MNIYAHPHICVERDDNGKIVFEKVEKRKKIQDTSSRPHVIHHFTLINIFRNYEILFFFFIWKSYLQLQKEFITPSSFDSSKIYI